MSVSQQTAMKSPFLEYFMFNFKNVLKMLNETLTSTYIQKYLGRFVNNQNTTFI